MKTLSELNEKTWYRMAKVIYGGAYLLFLSAELYYIFRSRSYYFENVGLTLMPGTIKSMIIFTVVSLVIYEAIRRAFYYVIFRTPFPKKK